MPDERASTELDREADSPHDDGIEPHGSDPAPPLAAGQDPDDLADDGVADVDDDGVDERSKLSFPTSDPPATWAGSDQPG